MLAITAVAAIAVVWTLVRLVRQDPQRLIERDRANAAFFAAFTGLGDDEDLPLEHAAVLCHMAETVADDAQPRRVLRALLRTWWPLTRPAAHFGRDLAAAHDVLRRLRPDLTVRFEMVCERYLEAVAARRPVSGALCRRLHGNAAATELLVPDLAAAYDGLRRAGAPDGAGDPELHGWPEAATG